MSLKYYCWDIQGYANTAYKVGNNYHTALSKYFVTNYPSARAASKTNEPGWFAKYLLDDTTRARKLLLKATQDVPDFTIGAKVARKNDEFRKNWVERFLIRLSDSSFDS